MDCLDCWQNSVLKLKVYICEIIVVFQKQCLPDVVGLSIVVKEEDDKSEGKASVSLVL